MKKLMQKPSKFSFEETEGLLQEAIRVLRKKLKKEGEKMKIEKQKPTPDYWNTVGKTWVICVMVAAVALSLVIIFG